MNNLTQCTIFIISITVLLTGCGSLGVKRVSLDYPTHQQMIAAEFQEDLWIPIMDGKGNINLFAVDEANAPRDSLSAFCKRDQGKLEQVAVDKDVSSSYQEVRKLSGLFACKNLDGKILWIVNVDARRNIGGLVTAQGFMFSVREYPIDQYLSERRIQSHALSLRFRQAMAKKDQFNTLSYKPKSKGDKVCTWENQFGYVVDATDDKVHVLVKGKANGDKGFFFDVTPQSQHFGGLFFERYMWDDIRKWGHCSFSKNN